MPTAATLERFIARVEENAHAEAVEEFYAEHSSMRENHGIPRVGRDLHIANERMVLARARSVSSQCVRPVFVSGEAEGPSRRAFGGEGTPATINPIALMAPYARMREAHDRFCGGAIAN